MKAPTRNFIRMLPSRFLWLAILTPILGVSAYSLFYIATSFGVPWPIAASMSACFDGVVLLAADYSVRYAQAGLSGSGPRTVVRVFALLAAYLQTFHARLGHEPKGSWLLWAALPIAAATVYEIHLRWERRKALARTGAVYPTPLPAFGLATWVLFPLSTMGVLREIVERRRLVLHNAAIEVANIYTTDPIAESEPANPRRAPTPRPKTAKPARAKTVNAHRPVVHIREWAKEHGHKVGDRGRIAPHIVEEYHAAHAADHEARDG